MLRDGNYCLFTGLSYFLPNRVVARCAHIIPFSIHSKVTLSLDVAFIFYIFF